MNFLLYLLIFTLTSSYFKNTHDKWQKLKVVTKKQISPVHKSTIRTPEVEALNLSG